MSSRRLLLVLRRDLAHYARRTLFWVWLALLVLLAWSLSTGKARIQSGDSSVGGTKAHITSEFAVTQQLVILTPLIYGFFVSVVAGMAVIQDEECGMDALLHTTSLRPGEYVWGKFLAALLAAMIVMGLHLGAMVAFNHGIPAGSTQEFRGPLHLANYLRPALLFGLPTLVFFAGVAFAIGERTRKPVLVFILPVAVLLGCIFFLWDWAPSWLDPGIDRALMLVDPAGFRWLNETQLKVDRGVSYYNSAPVPLDGVIVANRLIFLGLGIAMVALAPLHFRRTLRGVSRRAERAWRAGRLTLAAAGPTADVTETGDGTDQAAPAARPLERLAMSSRPPGLLAGAWTVVKPELVELRSSPGLYLFVPLLILEALGPNLIAVGPFDTPLLLTSGTFAVRTFNPLTTLVCLLLLFYTVESVWRERHTQLASISMATPVRTGSILLGKALANSLVGAAVLLLQFAAGAVWLLYQGKVGIEARPFVLLWGFLLLPTLFLWTSFVMAVLTLTRNRYATYAIALAVIFFTGYRQILGEINWVGNWPLWSAVEWSDLSVLELDRAALWLNRTMALGLAVLFVALTTRLYGRREPDAAATIQRLRPVSLLRSARWLIPLALVPVATGAVLWARVDRGFQGDATKKLQKDYWRKNLATYKDWPLPDLTAVDLAVVLDPAQSRLHVEGTYDLVNNLDRPIRQIPLSGGPHWESPSWTLKGKRTVPSNRSRLYVFTPDKPLPPGGSARIGFQFSGAVPQGITRKGGGTNEFILPSGVVLTSFSTSFAPRLGFLEEVGIDDENKHESKEYPDDFYEGLTESAFGPRRPFRTRIKITGPAEFTYNSIGTLTSETIADGRRTVVWESDQPVNFFNIVAGRWQVRRGDGTAVYYHKTHTYNVDEMLEALDAARTYYSEWFWPYPWNALKLSEFPGLATYAQGFATDITFSESIGFLSRSDPRSHVAFVVAAHESAHQWWGNLVVPGKGPGGNLLAEGTSHFSTLLLLEQVKGLRARIEFARQIEDNYAKRRSADSERPLVKIDGSRDGDQTVTYDKTGLVLWMLQNQMGREPMLAGIREFFASYRSNPDHPVLQDFLGVLRRHATDQPGFDAFVQQWFSLVVVPEYQISDVHKTSDGDGWIVTGRVQNVGTGTMPIDVAATRGERFPKEGKGAASPSYAEARTTLILSAGQSAAFSVRCGFEPQQILIDPDAKILMLRRKSAVARF